MYKFFFLFPSILLSNPEKLATYEESKVLLPTELQIAMSERKQVPRIKPFQDKKVYFGSVKNENQHQHQKERILSDQEFLMIYTKMHSKDKSHVNSDTEWTKHFTKM